MPEAGRRGCGRVGGDDGGERGYSCFVAIVAQLAEGGKNSHRKISESQGVVTPIGAVLTAETGDTTRSSGYEGFFPHGHGFLRRLMILWRAGL